MIIIPRLACGAVFFTLGLATARANRDLEGEQVPSVRDNPHFAKIEQCRNCMLKSNLKGLREITEAFLPTIEPAALKQSEGLTDFPRADQPIAEMNAAAMMLWYLGEGLFKENQFEQAGAAMEKVWKKFPFARIRTFNSAIWMPGRDAYKRSLIVGYIHAIRSHALDKYPFDPARSIYHGVSTPGILDGHPLQIAARIVFQLDGARPLEDAMAQMLASPEIHGIRHSDMIENLITGVYTPVDPEDERQWISLQKTLEDWGARAPESSMAKLAMVGFWINYAWRARGGGYASSVTDGGWKLFGERLAKAAQLQQKECIKNPMWFHHALLLGRGLGAENATQEAIFEEAIKEYPKFMPIYQQMEVYLLPRWHGRKGEWQKFALWVGRKQGSEMYLELCLNAEGFEGEGTLRNDPLIDWKFLRQGFETKIADQGESWIAANEFAKQARERGDKDATLAAFRNPALRYHPLLWNGMEEFTLCREWAGQ